MLLATHCIFVIVSTPFIQNDASNIWLESLEIPQTFVENIFLKW
jgi:hypothetical protein